MTPDQLAINTISLRIDRFEHLLDGCVEAGFSKVEFALSQPRKWMADHNADVAAVRELLKDCGVTCIGGLVRMCDDSAG